MTIDDVFMKLTEHPFTTIGLADREKFHTGMLSFVINGLIDDKKRALLTELWGSDTVNHCSFHESKAPNSIKSLVEQNSLVLVVKQGTDVKLWAEMKFKTTLSKDQLSKYQKNYPKAVGVLFALFTGVEKLPDGITEKAFPEIIVSFFDKNPLEDHIWKTRGRDEIALVRLWHQYLGYISQLTREFAARGAETIQNKSTWVGGLKAIKLQGVFQHYRHAKFREMVDAKGLKGAFPDVGVDQFNSHGNPGIEFFYELLPKQKPGRTGLQWQSGSLKLFAIGESENDTVRDQRLENLREGFPVIPETLGGLDNQSMSNGKFKSCTVANWNIMDAITDDQVSALFKGLSYLQEEHEDHKLVSPT